jgi:hypothetical protein
MDMGAAALLASGLACVGAGLSAVGIGIVFATTPPESTRKLGLSLTAGFGAACLLIALVLLYR